MAKGYQKVIEKVPVQFVRRQGDWVQEGGNNTLVVLGTDRAVPGGPATIDDGLGTVDADGGGRGTGTIIIVVGRKDLAGGGPDLSADAAALYLSQLTDVDTNLGTTFEGTNKGAAAVLVSDHVRFVFRNNLKISSAVSASHAFFDGDHLRVDMQGKAKLSMDVSGDASSVQIDVQDNTVQISSDGTITVTSKSKVVVNTSTAEVNADTSAMVKSPSVTIDADDTTVTGKLHVKGDTDVAGATRLATTLNVGAAATIVGVAAVGGLAGAGGGSIPGDLKMAGDVSAGGPSLLLHTHMLVGVKAGPDAGTTLNIGASAAKAADIAAQASADAAAAKAAEEAAVAQAAAEAQAAADTSAAGDSGAP